MSTQIFEQTLTVRTEPGDFKDHVERYKTNGWTLEAEDVDGAVMTHPAMNGTRVVLRSSPVVGA